jgi:hypothetical protein
VGSTAQENRNDGLVAEDTVADLLARAGRRVRRHVRKKTPFGVRIVDIEVRDANGNVLGGVEAKLGHARYRASQRAKDEWLRQRGYPVDLVREARYGSEN